LVVVQGGGNDHDTVMAFDRETGREVWHSLEGKAGYASILGIGSGKTRELIVWTASGLSGLNPATGASYWSQPRTEKWDQAVATPVWDPKSNQLLIASDREGALTLQLDPVAHTCRKLWEGIGFSALHSTPVVKDGFLYGINHNGDKLENCGEFRCVELASGNVRWAVTNVTRIGRWAQAHVTLNTGTDTFYISNEFGELILAKANPEGYHEMARAQVCGKTWSHPAYAGKRMFARTETGLVCVSLESGSP
jgi:outer membrane protein assembly factor BamB